MNNIYDLINRAKALRDETKIDSISPARVGALCEETLQYINEVLILASSPILHKVYQSVAAMQSDPSPKSDITGRELSPGQLVVISPQNASDATAGDIYRYDGPSGSTSAWTYIAKIGKLTSERPDWNAQASESGYIRNRTHYISWEGTRISIDLTNVKAGDAIPLGFVLTEYTKMRCNRGDVRNVPTNGEEFSLGVQGPTMYASFFTEGDQSYLKIKTSSFGIQNTLEVGDAFVHQLSEVYISNAISRISAVEKKIETILSRLSEKE